MLCKRNECHLPGYDISIVALSEMGKGKIENQDSVEIYADDEQVIVVIADGLGSAAFSKEGSSKIVRIAIDILSQTDQYDMLATTILKTWRDTIEGSLNQYDTTLKFIKVTAKGITFGGVGDGWIVLNGKNDYISVTADNTFSNQTDSILSFDLNSKFLTKGIATSCVSECLVSTDGFSEDMDKDNARSMMKDFAVAFSTDKEGFVDELSKTLENWPVETNRDDKTVAFLVIKETDDD